MQKNIDWGEFEKSEVERIVSEVEAIDAARHVGGEAAVLYNEAADDGASTESFIKASNAIIGIFAEKTKNLR